MSKSILEKLNVLLRARLNDLTDIDLSRLSPLKLGKDLKDEMAALRTQQQSAEDEEATIRQEITQLDQALVTLDEQIDQALQSGQNAQARHLQEQMAGLKRKRTLLENDLKQHQRVLAEFITQLSRLEAILEVSQRQQAVSSHDVNTPPSLDRDTSPDIDSARPSLSAKPSPTMPAQDQSIPIRIESSSTKPPKTSEPNINQHPDNDNHDDLSISEAIRKVRLEAQAIQDEAKGIVKQLQPQPAKPNSEKRPQQGHGDQSKAKAEQPVQDISGKKDTKRDDPDDDLSARRSRLAKPDS